MNLKLDNVFSDILGKSGQSVIKAILNGERDPKVLSDLADPRCRTSKEEIEKSLQATWDEEHLFEKAIPFTSSTSNSLRNAMPK